MVPRSRRPLHFAPGCVKARRPVVIAGDRRGRLVQDGNGFIPPGSLVRPAGSASSGGLLLGAFCVTRLIADRRHFFIMRTARACVVAGARAFHRACYAATFAAQRRWWHPWRMRRRFRRRSKAGRGGPPPPLRPARAPAQASPRGGWSPSSYPIPPPLSRRAVRSGASRCFRPLWSISCISASKRPSSPGGNPRARTSSGSCRAGRRCACPCTCRRGISTCTRRSNGSDIRVLWALRMQASVPRRILPVIVLSQFAGTSLWFAVNAVLPDLQRAWSLPATALATSPARCSWASWRARWCSRC